MMSVDFIDCVVCFLKSFYRRYKFQGKEKPFHRRELEEKMLKF